MRHSAFLIFLFFIALCSTGAQAQDFVLQGRVVDAETGEPLPYAAIYVEKGRGALTNIEGDYRLSVSNQDVLTFSFVGFEKLKLKASEVPSLIRLEPFSSTLKEVVVVPIDELGILKQVINNLKQDFSKHKKDRQGYFMRTLLKNEEDSYLIESLMTARSAVNLREEEMLSGRTGLNFEGDISRMELRLTNIQRVMEIGPSAFKSDYWEKAVKPLHSLSATRKYYDTDVETLFGSEGEKIYRITFHLNDKERPKWHKEYLAERRHIVGTAFVDAKSLRLLRFEGKVENAFQNVNWQRQPTDISFQMSYDYSQGFASVSSLAFEGGNEKMKYRGVLFNVQDDGLAASSGSVGDNILQAVNNAGFDATLWERFDIVRRTKEEEAATGLPLSASE